MPFQDSDDLQHQVVSPPGAIERWLRRIFVEDLNVKLLALGITLVLWFAVTGQRKPMTKRISGVQLSFVHADDMAISNDPPTKVDITLTGSNDKLALINPMDLLATVLVGDHTTGDRVIRLSRDRVKIDLPKDVQIEGFQPAIVSVRLEPRLERQIKVELKFEGKVPEGYQVYSATSNPATVRVRGPASIVNGVQEAATESILLDGRKTSFDLTQVAVDVPHQKVDVVDGLVQVQVEIGERAIEKSFSNVPVQSTPVQSTNGTNIRPQVAALTLSAPPWVFAQLHPEEIRLVADNSFVQQNGFRVELPAAMQSKVKIVSVKPARFLPTNK